MKMLLVVLLGLGIGGGVAAFVYDAHPMTPYYDITNERCPQDTGRGSPLECYDDYSRIMDAADRQDRWVALAAGVAAAGLFWLLVWFFLRRKSGVPKLSGQG